MMAASTKGVSTGCRDPIMSVLQKTRKLAAPGVTARRDSVHLAAAKPKERGPRPVDSSQKAPLLGPREANLLFFKKRFSFPYEEDGAFRLIKEKD